jgi:hypothetical protein
MKSPPRLLEWDFSIEDPKNHLLTRDYAPYISTGISSLSINSFLNPGIIRRLPVPSFFYFGHSGRLRAYMEKTPPSQMWRGRIRRGGILWTQLERIRLHSRRSSMNHFGWCAKWLAKYDLETNWLDDNWRGSSAVAHVSVSTTHLSLVERLTCIWHHSFYFTRQSSSLGYNSPRDWQFYRLTKGPKSLANSNI